MFAKKCVLQVAPTTVALLLKSTYRDAKEIGFGAQQIHLHTCLFDKQAGFNFGNEAFSKKEWQKVSRSSNSHPYALPQKVYVFQ